MARRTITKRAWAAGRSLVSWWILVAVAITLPVAGCGSSTAPRSTDTASASGVAAQSPAAILAAAARAAKSLQSVHITGSTATGGTPLSVDLTLVADTGARGTLSLDGARFQIVSVDGSIYLRGGRSFWAHVARPAATLFAGRWLKVAAGGQFASFAALTHLGRFFTKVLLVPGSVTKGAVKTVNGQTVVPLTDRATGATMYVAATGAPYPVEIVKPGVDGGRFSFGEFDRPVSLTAPADAISIGSAG